MRALIAGSVCLLAASALASWGVPVDAAVRQVAKTVPERLGSGQLPGNDPNIDQKLEILQADRYRKEGDVLTAEGNVRIQYRGYQIFGQKVTRNTKTQVFVLQGSGRLEGKTETITGDTVEINFETKTFAFREGTAVLQPDRLEGRVEGPLFVGAQSGSGTEREFSAVNGHLTTCELDHPHYQLRSRTTVVYPGRRAILRDVQVQILGRTVLRLPYLSIPLTESARRTLPEIGQNRDEGYFIKSKFSIPFPGQSYLDTRLDYMTKLGLGTGADYVYRAPGIDGVVSLYAITGTNRTLFGRTSHRQQIGRGELSLDANFNRNNYLTAPDLTSLNSRLQYVLPWGDGSSRFGYSLNGSESGPFRTTNQSFTLADSRNLGGGLRSQLDLNLTNNIAKSSGVTTRRAKRLDIRFLGTQELRSFSADLLYQRSLPIGTSEGFFSGSDRTPLLTLRSTAQRLFGNAIGRPWPFTFESSIGQLADPGLSKPITRTTFDIGLRKSETSGRTRIDYGGRFHQGVYSDDTAQFVGAYDARYQYTFQRDSFINLSYRFLRQNGFTPLAIDRTGRADAFNIDLGYRPSRNLTFAAQTGYDLQLADRGIVPWQILTLRGEFRSGRETSLVAFANYDHFSQVWSNARLDAQFRLFGARFNAGVRYDGRRNTWAGANLQVSGLQFGRLSASALLAYNGYTKQLEAQHYALTYDMHCTEAVLEIIDNRVGFRSGRQIAFFIRIKAFPFTSPLGVGQRGQAIGSANGFGG